MTLTFLNGIFLLSMPGGSEWILILLVVLLFFGGKKIPDLMKGIGRGVREFNDAKTHVKNEIEAGMNEKDVSTPPVAQPPYQQSQQPQYPQHQQVNNPLSNPVNSIPSQSTAPVQQQSYPQQPHSNQ